VAETHKAIVTTIHAETGEELGRIEIGPGTPHGYVVVTAPDHEISHEQVFANGTRQFTIKKRESNQDGGES